MVTFACFKANAQYTSPNTGVTLRLNDIVTNAPTTLTFNNGIYTLSQNLTIAQNDTFIIDSNAEIHINADVSFDCCWKFQC